MPSIPERPSIPMPEFTDEQLEALIEYMTAVGKSRGVSQHADFSEVDFLMGCATTLFALGKQHKIPGAWLFGPMSGRSALDLPTVDRMVFVIHRDTAAEPVTLYEHRGQAETHLEYLIEGGNSDGTVLYSVPLRHDLHPSIAKAMNAEDDQ